MISMNKRLLLIPLLVIPFILIIPSTYATDQTYTLDQIFGHMVNFTLGDKLVILNNDTNFSHSFKAISNDGYTRSTPSLFPKDSYKVQFEQPGNYTIRDDFNSKNIGYINVINQQPITPITQNTTSLSFSGISNSTITPIPDTTTSTSTDAAYWKSQAMTWKFLAQQYYNQLQAFLQLTS